MIPNRIIHLFNLNNRKTKSNYLFIFRYVNFNVVTILLKSWLLIMCLEKCCDFNGFNPFKLFIILVFVFDYNT